MLSSQQILFLYIIISVIIILLLLTLIITTHSHTKKVMYHISGMLDAAINGTFKEMHLDESMLSYLESKFAAYLSAQETSAEQTADEKDTIKELISDISHQTKTPIANILLYSELLSEQEQELSPQGKEYLASLHTQTQKLNFLISSLIKMSRLETDIFVLHPVSAPILPVLEKVVLQLAPKAQEKGLRIILPEHAARTNTLTDSQDSTSFNFTAVFDEKWTQEALFNVVDNAVKYTQEGSITIEITSFELFLRITITDTGIGISEEEHAKIFSRFYRSPQVHDKEGIGIGLYLTREIINRQGGYLKLTSSPGKGSSFAVYLPK